MEINMATGFSGCEMHGVVCPECGAGGGSHYPCWCSNCHQKGEKVMMLPSVNGFTYVTNWSEYFKSQKSNVYEIELPSQVYPGYDFTGNRISVTGRRESRPQLHNSTKF